MKDQISESSTPSALADGVGGIDKMEFHLVTTAEQQSWPAQGPVLFLGQWCLLHKAQSQWQQLSHQVLPYRWDDREQLYQDYLYLQGVTDKVMPDLAAALNRAHGTEHSTRYWQILCGSWVSDFSEIVYERYQALKQAFDLYSISATTVLEMDDDDTVPLDMEAFPGLFVGDRWNHWLYSKIIRHCFSDCTLVEKTGQWDKPLQRQQDLPPSKKDKIRSLVNRASGLLGRGNKTFFMNSRFGIKGQALLELKLGQIPAQWYSPMTRFCPVDRQKRQSLSLNFDCDNQFEALLKWLIPQQLPRFYLEGFERHQALLQQCRWPKAPQVIFTSNSYSHDDMFKLYSAQNTEKGCKLLFGQHGGNYGVGRWNSSESHILKAADYFVNWGWSFDEEKHLKAMPAAALASVPGLKPNPEGPLLLATMAVPRYSYWLYSIPSGPQMLSYIAGVVDFFKGLEQPIFEQSLMRPYPSDMEWDCTERYCEQLPGLRFDDRKKGMLEKLGDCRLFIGSYDATTQLETLAANFPSVLFWDANHYEVRPEAEADYEMLRQAGILHETPQSAAQQVNRIWDDVSGWWQSDKVQQARVHFCRKYAWQSDDWQVQWAAFFRQLMK